jgi:hypothetical protein
MLPKLFAIIIAKLFTVDSLWIFRFFLFSGC